MKPTLYLECTNTYVTDVLTGIQRVVRHIVQEATQANLKDFEYHIQPVIIVGEQFYPIDQLPKHTYQQLHALPQDTLSAFLRQSLTNLKSPTQLITFGAGLIKRLSGFMAMKKYLRRRHPVLFARIKPAYVWLRAIFFGSTERAREPVVFGGNDILFLLDSSWMPEIWSALKIAHLKGAHIIFNIYDLIPISHPQFCDKDVSDQFADYYHRSMQIAAGYMAISATVRDDAKRYLVGASPEFSAKPDAAPQFDYFYLGADFCLDFSETCIRSELKQIFSNDTAVFLAVGTIEPRKNHAYLLDVFERLWSQGSAAKLLIAGKIGWKVDTLMVRLRSHPQLNRNLFLFHTLSDMELSFVYSRSKSLVFPSVVEGFGLPIIEALQHGLPVIASDIPIHREIGGQLVYYVDHENPESLVNQISEILRHGIAPDHTPGGDYRWLSWQEATHELLKKLVCMARQRGALS